MSIYSPPYRRQHAEEARQRIQTYFPLRTPPDAYSRHLVACLTSMPTTACPR
jgi:hypothetical protein